MTPASARRLLAKNATAGVGMGPTSKTSTPIEQRPDVSADSIMYPESRVSFPMTIRWRPGLVLNTCAAARPSFKAISLVIGSTLATPLIPSVPKSRRITAPFPAYPLACDDYDALNEYRLAGPHAASRRAWA